MVAINQGSIYEGKMDSRKVGKVNREINWEIFEAISQLNVSSWDLGVFLSQVVMVFRMPSIVDEWTCI
jgi:hypothetical protein